jgi:esterase/lipase superfamily enzyme
MQREYRKAFSQSLNREMELLVFGHAGAPVLAFPTSAGRFYELEDHGVVAALEPRISSGELQLFCVDSVDAESWYNRRISPRARIARHIQFENYLTRELVPEISRAFDSAKRSGPQGIAAFGCSFGGYHAVNLALRHPDLFTAVVSLSGAFDLSSFLDGYSDQESYLHLPTWYLPNLTDPWFLTRLRRNRLVLATGWDDQCRLQNEQLDHILNQKQIPHHFHVWAAENAHDWPTWCRMAQDYL